MKVRVLKNLNGTVSIIHYAPNSKLTIDEAFVKATPPGTDHEDIDSSELPQDREDRNAWEWDSINKKVRVNQAKAQKNKDDKKIKEDLKKSAKDKLIALGLTKDEINSL